MIYDVREDVKYIMEYSIIGESDLVLDSRTKLPPSEQRQSQLVLAYLSAFLDHSPTKHVSIMAGAFTLLFSIQPNGLHRQHLSPLQFTLL